MTEAKLSTMSRERNLFVVISGRHEKDTRNLTREGIDQAEELGRLIRSAGKPKFTIYSSMSNDGMQSSNIIAKQLGGTLIPSGALTSGALKPNQTNMVPEEIGYGGVRIKIHGHANLYGDPEKVEAVFNSDTTSQSIVLVFNSKANMNLFLDYMQSKYSLAGEERKDQVTTGEGVHIRWNERYHYLLRDRQPVITGEPI